MTSQIPEQDFPITVFNNVAVIQMPPRLSVLEAVAFKHACSKILNGTALPEQILLNCKQTTFIDSSGIGALVSNLKATREQEVQLVLQNVHPTVKAVLSMTGLDRVLTIESHHFSPSPKTNEPGEKLPRTHPSVHSPLKRVIDIVGSLVGLGITGGLLIPIAIAIRLDSSGPIFFSQTRCGWLNRPFRIWKFRSMCTDAEAQKRTIKNELGDSKLFKNENDPRITKVGRFLRRTSLDELPQFWNVLKGEMSLVGTRPPTPDEVERYKIPEWQRLDVKPGMTGEWQVNGRSRIREFEEVIKLDLRYQKNWSLIYDLQLILKTITILFNKNSGAA